VKKPRAPISSGRRNRCSGQSAHASNASRRQPATQIDEVVLVGDARAESGDREELFGKEPHKGVNPDEVVRSVRPCRLASSPAT
jgi:hypothetical protein